MLSFLYAIRATNNPRNYKIKNLSLKCEGDALPARIARHPRLKSERRLGGSFFYDGCGLQRFTIDSATVAGYGEKKGYCGSSTRPPAKSRRINGLYGDNQPQRLATEKRRPIKLLAFYPVNTYSQTGFINFTVYPQSKGWQGSGKED